MEATLTAPPRFATRVGQERSGHSWSWPLAVVLHAIGVAAVVVLPLLGEEPLPPANTTVARAFFAEPVLAPPPPPPPPPQQRAAVAPRVTAEPTPSAFTAPIDVPETIDAVSSLDLGVEGGVAGGVEGGVPGGVVGGVVGGLEEAPPPPTQIVRVGGVVREPRKVKDVAPVYPDVARAAKIEGIVILECTINPQGRVDAVRVLRGLPTLNDAAVEAVRQWVYTPTLLGGAPVSVLMTVTVNFVLRRPTPF
jgi:protein TonB